MARKRITLLTDALYYTHPESGASVEKAQGVVIGAVSALMSVNRFDFRQAIKVIKDNLPDDYCTEAIPEAWREDFEGGR